MEQPKDYEVSNAYDELIKEELKASSLFVRVVFSLQKHIFLTIASSFSLGYLAGTYFGKFW